MTENMCKVGDIKDFNCHGAIRQKRCIHITDGIMENGIPYHIVVWRIIGSEEEKQQNRKALNDTLKALGSRLYSIGDELYYPEDY